MLKTNRQSEMEKKELPYKVLVGCEVHSFDSYSKALKHKIEHGGTLFIKLTSYKDGRENKG